jgi:hypothetical protein
MTKLLDRRRPGRCLPPAAADGHRHLLHVVEQPGQAYANNVGWRLDYHLANLRGLLIEPGPMLDAPQFTVGISRRASDTLRNKPCLFGTVHQGDVAHVVRQFRVRCGL